MTIKVKELPECERPYEKLETYGADKLSNAELLAIIIRNGTKEETSIMLAQKLLKLKVEKNNLSFMQDISIEELRKIKGIGRVKAIQIKAMCELTKRMLRPINFEKIKIRNTKDVADLLMNELRYEKVEKAKLLLLDIKQRLLKIVDISVGGSNFASIEPKELLLEAIKTQASRIILVHNHPSGDTTPSSADYLVTDRIYEAADLIGIELIDHVIIGEGTYESVMLSTKDGKYKKNRKG